MSLKRTVLLLAVCGLALLWGAPAHAQIGDMQLFGPDDLGGFGGGPRAKEGVFFGIDALYWTISQGENRAIGVDPGYESTAFITSPQKWGTRVDAGAVYDHQGLLFSWYGLFGYTPKSARDSGARIAFENSPFPNANGPDSANSLFATEFIAHDTVDTWGVEMNYLLRSHPLYHGGIIELFGGARYIQFDEEFSVIANRGSLDRHWLTDAQNHLIGPQLGLRWFRQWGPVQLSVEGRYLAGFNQQNFRLIGNIAAPTNNAFNIARFKSAYSNTVELRLDLKYQLTDAIFFKVGWTGLWMDHIARAPNNVVYDSPLTGVGIEEALRVQDVLLNGLNFGVTINR